MKMPRSLSLSLALPRSLSLSLALSRSLSLSLSLSRSLKEHHLKVKALRVIQTLRAGATPLGLRSLLWEPGQPENHDFHAIWDFRHLGLARLTASPDVNLELQESYRPETGSNRSGRLWSMLEKYAEPK